MLLWNAAFWCSWRVRSLFGSTAAPPLASTRIGKMPAITVGIIHGFGAETPTQLMLFLMAANLGGVTAGLLGLGSFLAGMLLMNSLVCATATGVFQASMRRPRVLRCAAAISAAYSMALGAAFLIGTSSVAAVLGR
jgi:high-affinity nickel-transport protein